MKLKPLLSIIIPIYNVEEYIDICFQSIVVQNFKYGEVEVICVDDGSTDRSGTICDEYANKYKYFMVFHQKNKGVSSARNEGLKKAKGKYIAWIDPDDYIDCNWYKKISECLDEKNDIIFFDYTILKYDKYMKKRYYKSSKYIMQDEILRDLVIDQKLQSQLWQKIIKRELYYGIEFPEKINCMEDYAVLHKIFLKAKTFYYLSYNLYYYRTRKNSLVNNVDIKKSYNCYLIAKERYNYLIKKNFKVSKLGFLIQALGVCDQYYSSDVTNKIMFMSLYKQCKKDIVNHIFYILKSTDCNGILKIKFILCYIGLFFYCKKLYRLMRERII